MAIRFWVFDKRSKKALGPYTLERLRNMPGLLSPDSKLALEGASKATDWRKAKEFPQVKAAFPEWETADGERAAEGPS